jgi:hypothetical protein
MYASDNGIASAINEMNYESYGLPDIKNIRKSKKKLSIDNTITDDNVEELFKPEEGQNYMGFKDHLQRAVVLKKDVFKQHTKDRYIKKPERRHQLFPHVEDVLSKPDEVWFNDFDGKKFQALYIKHYSDTSLAVSGSLGKNNIEIKTWFELIDEDLRKGMLIHEGKK